MSLIVGIPKEIKPREKRVGLTPGGVQALCEKGIRVLVESGAGEASLFPDQAYRDAGAEMAASHEELFECADLIQKVKEPLAPEFDLFNSGHLFFCFLHLASPNQCDLVHRLMDARVTSIAYETLTVEGQQPILKPMSEIAGALSAMIGAYLVELDLTLESKVCLPQDFQERLEQLGRDYPKAGSAAPGSRAIIYGAGFAGMKAADYLQQTGGRVTLVEPNRERIAGLQDWVRQSEGRALVHPEDLSPEMLQEADLMIGAAHRAGHRAVKVMDGALLRQVSSSRKKVIMDIAIDQGGNFPEARPTTYDHPLYHDSAGNIRFSVANIPSLCGPYASTALTSATLAYTQKLAADPEAALKACPELREGINTRNGKVENQAIREAHQL